MQRRATFFRSVTRMALILTLLVGAHIVSACTPSAPEKTITVTAPEEPDTLSPLYSASWYSDAMRSLWLRGLWIFDDQNKPVAELAAEIPSPENGGISSDGSTITIKLRDDAIWSDGVPVTADDFVFTYDMIMADQNTVETRYPYEDYVESVTASDDHTLVVKLFEPFAPWLTLLFDFVLPQHVLAPVFEEAGSLDFAEWNRAPIVGIGPYVFSRWEPDSYIQFDRNENWSGPSPSVERIVFRIVPDDTAQVAAIKVGDTDIGMFLSYADVPEVEATGSVDIHTVPSGYVEGWFLNFNADKGHPALQDGRVRLALALATDRDRIVQDMLLGLTALPSTFWDATPPYGNPNLDPYPYDPDQAEQLLNDAGWVDTNGDGIRDKDGVELVLRYVTNDKEIRQDVQVVVQQMWAEVGIGSELISYPGELLWNSFGQGGPIARGEYDVAQYSDSTPFPDPDASYYWMCSEIPSEEYPEGSNWQYYCNEEVDRLFDEQASAIDSQIRMRVYHEIGQIMYDDVVWIGLWMDPDIWSVNDRVSGVKFSGAIPFWNVTDWGVTPQ